MRRRRFSLSLSPWLLDETAKTNTSGFRRRRKTVILSLSVSLLNGDGPLSLWISLNRKVKILLCSSTMHIFDYASSCSDCLFYLVVGSILSLGGSPRRRQSCLSVALLDGDGALCRKRDEEASSNKGLQVQYRRFSLSLSPWLLNETAKTNTSGFRRRRKTVILSLSVSLLDGDGPLSLWISLNRKVKILLCSSTMHIFDCASSCSDCLFYLVVGSILSLGGTPRRRQSCLSVALLDGDGALCRKRDEEASSNKGLQVQYRFGLSCNSLVTACTLLFWEHRCRHLYSLVTQVLGASV
ncbi:hypothetical protein Bca4012_005572 [Brassica carinata]